jgi:hypothetical protein
VCMCVRVCCVALLFSYRFQCVAYVRMRMYVYVRLCTFAYVCIFDVCVYVRMCVYVMCVCVCRFYSHSRVFPSYE